MMPEPPYPLRGGGPMRTAAVMHYLARRYALDAVFFAEPGSQDPRAALPPGLIQDSLLIELPRHSKQFHSRFLRNWSRYRRGAPPLVDRFSGFGKEVERFAKGRRWAVAVLEHFWCVGYRSVLDGFCDAIVIDLHNVESQLHLRSGALEHWPVSAMHRRFAEACREQESFFLPQFDRVLVASRQDRRLALDLAPQAKVDVYPNTIPWRDLPETAKEQRIVFSGNFAYPPNRDGVKYFNSRIWPLLSRRYAGLHWMLLGKNPEAVSSYVKGDNRIQMTGEVEDAFPPLAASLAAVVPLRSGSGTRVKILEAWAAGVPVVTTSIGAEGLPVVDGESALLADDEKSFAAAVTALIDSTQLRNKVGNGGRRVFEKYFTWEAGWKGLAALGI